MFEVLAKLPGDELRCAHQAVLGGNVVGERAHLWSPEVESQISLLCPGDAPA